VYGADVFKSLYASHNPTWSSFALFGLGLDDVKLWPLFVCAQAGLAMHVVSNINMDTELW